MHSAVGPTTASVFWPMADVSQTADGVVTHSEDVRIAQDAIALTGVNEDFPVRRE